MYVYHRILPPLQVIKIEVQKNFDHQSGIDMEEKILFRLESHIFPPKSERAKSLKACEGCTNPIPKADLFLRIFEAIPGTLKRPSLRSLSTCWRMRDNTVCY